MTSLAYDEFCSEREFNRYGDWDVSDDLTETLDGEICSPDGYAWMTFRPAGDGANIIITYGDVRDMPEYGDGPRYTRQYTQSLEDARGTLMELVAEGWE